MDGIIVARGLDGSYIRCTKDGLYSVDRYGNEICITDKLATYTQNAPTYAELYDYWLKTHKEN